MYFILRLKDRLLNYHFRHPIRLLVVLAICLIIGLLVKNYLSNNNIDISTWFLDEPLSNVASLPDTSNWPMFRQNSGHTAFVSSKNGLPQGVIKWQYFAQAFGGSSPAVVDGRLFVGTAVQTIIALDTETGSLIWQHEVSGPVDSSVAVIDDLLYVGLRDGNVIALDIKNGQQKWSFATDGPIYGSPAVDRGVVFIGSGDSKVYALDAVDGTKRWEFQANRPISSSLAVNQEVVVVTSDDRFLYILDRKNGRVLMDFRISTSSHSPVLGESQLLLSEGLRGLTAVDWNEGDIVFERFRLWLKMQLFAWGIAESPPIEKGWIWSFASARENFVGSPALAFSNIYTATPSTLIALDLSTGEALWKFSGKSDFNKSPFIMGEEIFAVDIEGRLYAVDVHTGQNRWNFVFGDAAASEPVGVQGVIYVTSVDGTLYAIE